MSFFLLHSLQRTPMENRKNFRHKNLETGVKKQKFKQNGCTVQCEGVWRGEKLLENLQNFFVLIFRAPPERSSVIHAVESMLHCETKLGK